MKERILYAVSQPSLVTELFKKKNRKCLVALVLLTFVFFIAIPVVKAKEEHMLSKAANAAHEKYIGKEAIIPGTNVKSKANATTRKMISMAATISTIPIYGLSKVPSWCVDIITLKTTASGSGSGWENQIMGLTGGLSTGLKDLKTVTINQAIPAFSGIGLAIAALHFLLGMIAMTTSDRMTIETWIKYWAKFIVSVAAIFYSADLFKLFWEFGDLIAGWTDEKISFTQKSSSVGDSMYYGVCKILDTMCAPQNPAAVAGKFFLGSLLSIIMIMFFVTVILCIGIISILTMLVVFIIAVTRVLELCIRGAFLPIGIASLSDDGWHGPGGRYFKKLFALAMQSGIIIFISLIMEFLFSKVLGNLVSGMGTTFVLTQSTTIAAIEGLLSPIMMILCCLVIVIAGIAAMFKSMQMANDIIGA